MLAEVKFTIRWIFSIKSKGRLVQKYLLVVVA